MANQKLQIDIIAKDLTKRTFGGLQGALGRLKKSVFSLQTAFVGLGAGLVIRNLVNTGKNLENLQVRLKFLLKDTNEGAKAFENMTKFASKVPFSLEEIQSGSGILATVTDNANDLQNMLEITGNVAAVTGLDFRTAAEQIQRSFSAGIGAADLFREKGVRNMLGFKAGATVSIEETVQAFERVFGRDGRFGQATDELANTFAGTLSMIGDKIFNFKKVLLEAGFFEELKKQFGDLDEFLEKNSKKLDQFATAIGKNLARAIVGAVEVGKKLLPFLKEVKEVLTGMVNAFSNLPSVMQQAGIIGAFLLGKKGFLGLAIILDFMNRVDNFTEKFGDKPLEKEIKIFTDESKLNDPTTLMNQLGSNKEITKELEKQQEKIKPLVMSNRENFEIANKMLTVMKEQQETVIDIFEHQKKLHQGFNELPKDLEGIGGALDGFGEGMKSEFDVTMFERFKEAGQSSLQSLKSSISDFIMTGKMSFDTLKTAIIRSIVEALVGAAVTAAIKKSTMLFKFSAIKEGLISAYKAGAKALASVPFPLNILAASAVIGTGLKFVDKIKGFEKGGAVAKGQPVLVGERGAEMFVPNQTGQITQSARGTGGGAVNVNFNINTVDASGFEELLVRSRGTITQLINSAVNERGRESLI
jgi:hypothetical protein